MVLLAYIVLLISRINLLDDQLATPNEECCEKQLPFGNPLENVLSDSYVWPNATVAYEFHGVFEQHELANIHLAMEAVMDVSCVKFKERASEGQYLVITNTLGQGCWADTGRQERELTYMNLAPNCTRSMGTILHELMHVLGFLHQHTRPDRDAYVCVRYDNIVPLPGTLYNYEIVYPWTRLAFPLPYDYESILHYTPDMYSVHPGRLPTMFPRHPWTGIKIEQRDRLTDYDVLAIQFLYCV